MIPGAGQAGVDVPGIAVTRALWGLVLLARPDVLVGLAGDRPTPLSRLLFRALGIRHLLQSAVTVAAGPRSVRRLAMVDLLHAASALLLAAVSRRWRRSALTAYAEAATWALAGRVRSPAPREGREQRG